MRLIDADKLMLSLADWKLQEAPTHAYEKPKEFTADDMQRMIWRTIRDCESAVEEQPTVDAIPIELYEQVKGERDVAIEQLKALNIELFEKPYLKAIPIDWIKDYVLRLPDGIEAYKCILIMLEELKRDLGIEENPDELLEKLSDILSVFPKLQGLVMDVLGEKKND